MRLFLASARAGVPVHHRTRKIISASLDLVDDKLRRSPRMSRPFFELLLHPAGPLPVLEVMLETGLLAAYIPEFSGISTLAQHDLYHIYTVDRHLLQTVAELRLLVEQIPRFICRWPRHTSFFWRPCSMISARAQVVIILGSGRKWWGRWGQDWALSQRSRIAWSF